MFDFRLKVFDTVARRLNFTKAAEELYITQPAVSRHIQEIENHYKVKLFERAGSRIKLTNAGNALLHYTSQLFSLYRDIDFELNNLSQRHNGRVRMGASTTIAQYVLPPVLASFREKFNQISISLAINNTSGIEEDLQNDAVDFGIIEGHSKNKSFRYTEFVEDEILLVARASNPMGKRLSVKPADLLKFPFLLRESGSGTLEVIAHALKPLGIKISQLKMEMQLSSTESIKSYIQHSDCFAFVSRYSILNELANKELVVLGVNGLRIRRHFYFVQAHGGTQPLTELFLKFARHYNFW